MRAAAAYLRDQGATKVASLGWCFGGAQSLQLALSGEDMGATIIYYGRLATTTAALAPIEWPVLGIFAGADQAISVESVNQFDAALDQLSIVNEIYIYPGVGHAFANPSGMNYAAAETQDAWGKTVAFLRKHL
jgi:carboxymethylenebutenolidase